MKARLLVLTYLLWDPSSLVYSVYKYVPLWIVVNVSWICLDNSWQSLKRTLFSGCCFSIPTLPTTWNPPPLHKPRLQTRWHEHNPLLSKYFLSTGAKRLLAPTWNYIPESKCSGDTQEILLLLLFVCFIFPVSVKALGWGIRRGLFLSYIRKDTPQAVVNFFWEIFQPIIVI